jgi:hypothetical protein
MHEGGLLDTHRVALWEAGRSKTSVDSKIAGGISSRSRQRTILLKQKSPLLAISIEMKSRIH